MAHRGDAVKRTQARILLAEDERTFRETVSLFLAEAGYQVEAVPDGAAAWEAFRRAPHDLCVFDIRMPGMDGLALLEKVMDFLPTTPVVMVTAHGSIESAVEALRRGAKDYITKPCDLDEMCLRIERVLANSSLALRAEALERDRSTDEFGALLGDSPRMGEVFRLIEKVAPTPSTVLVTGESGTGKELVAREIHRRSGLDRFVPVNCGAIPENLLESELFGHRKGSFTGATAHKEGLFRIADGGTIFLDEIGELPISLQVKLLRALDTGEIQPVGAPGPIKCEPRIIAATNKNLEAEVKEGKFREDLFYRLHVFEIPLPALRDRQEDIPLLAKHFVARYATRARKKIEGIRPDAARALMSAPWRGNVRELENIIERAVILCDGGEILLADLPSAFSDPGEEVLPSENLRLAIERFERDYIRRVIERTGGDKRAAAEILGIGLSSLYRKLTGEDEEKAVEA